MIERSERNTPLDPSRSRLPSRAFGQRLDARYGGEGELHASAMVATFLILRMLKTAGAVVVIGCVLRAGLRRNAWMLDIHGMC